MKNEANSCKKNNENDNEDSKVGLDEDVKAKVMKMVIMEIERCSLFAIMVLHGKRESGSESDNEDQEVWLGVKSERKNESDEDGNNENWEGSLFTILVLHGSETERDEDQEG